MLILPGASLETTRARAESLRKGAPALQVRHGDQYLSAITLSLGVAVLPDHGESGEAVLQAADAALYRARQSGEKSGGGCKWRPKGFQNP